MLQQTRVDTVIPYYHRFIEAFPTVKDLAEAERQSVLKLWEGLGYYSRARNMQDAARQVMIELDGKMPKNYDELLKLKGIGPYTAAAISSIAFGEKQAVVDGNVLRVICRYYDISQDIRSARTKNEVQEIVAKLIPKSRPGDFNQSVMELGATICTPANPDCEHCPVAAGCIAYKTARTESLPYKSSAKKIPHHQIGVGIIVDPDTGKLLIARRPENAMLGGLWEFPGGKQKVGESISTTVQRELKEELGVEISVYDKLMDLKHAYSHFKITMHAYWCRIEKGTPKPKSSSELKWVSPDELEMYPFPKANKTLTESITDSDRKPTEFINR